MVDKSEQHAFDLDEEARLGGYRKKFNIPDDWIYLLGNSLGLLSYNARDSVDRVMDEWAELGIKGWTEGKPAWFYYAERVGEKASELVGAEAEEVICTGTTTLNIHQLVSTLYDVDGERKKILADELNFPTDIYALESQVKLRGFDPEEDLVLVESEDGRTLDEEKIVQMMDDEIALVLLPSVLYRSGQLLDMEYLTEEAHKRGIKIGFDCSHSVGAVPHRFDEWGVDFAMWCSYKYMNGGPGSPAFVYLNKKHFDKEPGLAGWFGYVKEKQFDLLLEFESSENAGGLQISSPGIIGCAAVDGALEILLDAGIENVREKSKRMTSYFMSLIDEVLSVEPYDFSIGTPRDVERRGSHVAVEHPEAYRINQALKKRGVIADFRPPDVIRLAVSPLYNTYHELWRTVEHLKKIIDDEEYKEFSGEREAVT